MSRRRPWLRPASPGHVTHAESIDLMVRGALSALAANGCAKLQEKNPQ